MILLRALEENLHSSMLLLETLGCGWRAGAGTALRGGPWRLLCWRGSPMLDASDGARSNSHACMPISASQRPCLEAPSSPVDA